MYILRAYPDSTPYWPVYINKSRAKFALGKYDDGEKALMKIWLLCQSEYWVAYAKLYLAVGYFNNGTQCEKSLKYYEEAQHLKEDPDLFDQIENFGKHLKKTCK